MAYKTRMKINKRTSIEELPKNLRVVFGAFEAMFERFDRMDVYIYMLEKRLCFNYNRFEEYKPKFGFRKPCTCERDVKHMGNTIGESQQTEGQPRDLEEEVGEISKQWTELRKRPRATEEEYALLCEASQRIAKESRKDGDNFRELSAWSNLGQGLSEEFNRR